MRKDDSIQFNTDIYLYGLVWIEVCDVLKDELKIFSTYMDIFIFCTTLGIYYDKQLDHTNCQEKLYIPRTVLYSRRIIIEELYESAVLSTQAVGYSHLSLNERLSLTDFSNSDSNLEKIDFICKFANYGSTILNSLINKNSDSETITNIFRKYNEIFNEISLNERY